MTTGQYDKSQTFLLLKKVIENLLQISRSKDLKDRPQISLETDIYDDLEIDSLEIMDLISAIEKEFHIALETEELATKRKITDMVDFLHSMVVAKNN